MKEILITNIIFAFLIIIFITPIIALIFRLIKKTSFIKTWAISSIILVGLSSFIITVTLSALLFEVKLNTNKLDTQFEDIENEQNIEENSTENILAQIFTTGSYGKAAGKYGRGNNASVDSIVKNYSDKDFKGKLIIYAIYKEEKIGEKEIEIELPSKEWKRKNTDPSDLQINRKIWYDVEFEYVIQGSFK